MKIEHLNEEKKAQRTAPERKPFKKDMKIVGIVNSFDNDGRVYYIASDGEEYYLFVGKACIDPDNYYS